MYLVLGSSPGLTRQIISVSSRDKGRFDGISMNFTTMKYILIPTVFQIMLF